MHKTLGHLLAATLVVAFGGTVRGDDQAAARDLVAKAIKAAGGEAKLAKYRSQTWKETGTYYGMGAGLPYTGTYAVRWPDKFRMEIQGVFTIVVNGDKGWMSAMGNTQELTKEQIAEQKEERFAGWVTTLLPLKDKGFTVVPLGETKVGDRAAVGVRVSHQGHRDVNLYFDKENHLLIKSEHQAKAEEQGGKEVKQEVYYAAYKDFDGVKIPTKITVKRDGENYVEGEESDIKPVENLDDALFAKP